MKVLAPLESKISLLSLHKLLHGSKNFSNTAKLFPPQKITLFQHRNRTYTTRIILPETKPASLQPKNGWLEYELFSDSLFSGAFAVSFREGITVLHF